MQYRVNSVNVCSGTNHVELSLTKIVDGEDGATRTLTVSRGDVANVADDRTLEDLENAVIQRTKSAVQEHLDSIGQTNLTLARARAALEGKIFRV